MKSKPNLSTKTKIFLPVLLLAAFALSLAALSIIEFTPPKTEVVTSSQIPVEPVENTLVVSFNPETTKEEIAAYIESIGGEIESEIAGLNSVTIKVPGNYSPPENESEIVAVSEPDYFVSILQDSENNTSVANINDPKFPEQWIFSKYNIVQSWAELTEAEKNLKIAVIDSGICANHEDLSGRIIDGYDFLENDSTPQDENGHGCAISGIIAANVNNGVGIVGVSETAKIMPLKVLNAQGIGTYSDVAEAIVYAVDNGANVINMSLGGVNASSLLESAVNYAKDKGVNVYAAAGNNGTEGALYPARYDYVIGVGSINQNLEQSSFSNFGAGVDVFAPGENILTTSLDGGYKFVNGTSFASAVVSGWGDSVRLLDNQTQSVSGIASSDLLVSSASHAECIMYNTGTTNDRVLILVPGINTSAGSETELMASWSSITNKIGGLYGNIVYFSYDQTNPKGYSINKTWESLRDHHIPLLRDLITNCKNNRPASKFDLIGHSMGGLVINEYMKIYNLTGERALWVDNSITLHSPVNGAEKANWIPLFTTIADSLGIPAGTLEYFVDNLPAVIDMYSMKTEIVKQQNVQFANSFKSKNVNILTLANNQDQVVISSVSTIQGYEKEYDLGISFNNPTAIVGHNQLLDFGKYPEIGNYVYSFLTRNPSAYECENFGTANIAVYKDSDCQGVKEEYSSTTGRINFVPLNTFNDSISSIKVKNGWSVRVYLDHSSTGNNTSRCIRTSMWDLSKDYFTIGQTNLTIDNKISSLQVFNDDNCGAGAVCTLGENNVNSLSCGGSTNPTNPTGCAGIPEGKYCGGPIGLNPTSLYYCKNGASTQLQTCSYGCNVQAQGTADYCNASPISTTGSCPNGNNGNYCGAGLGTQYESNSLYSCQNGAVTKINACSLGCLQKPAGTNDVCKASTSSGSCPAGGDGDYCGKTLGLDSNTLYNCNSGNITLKQICNNGCEPRLSGTPDVCYPPGQGTPTPPQQKVQLWGNSNYTSIRLEVPEGESNAPERGVLYKSIKIPDGWSVILYDHPIGQTGAQTCLSSSSDLLESMGWYNSIDAIKVASTNLCPTNNNEVEICTQTGHNGHCDIVTTDIPSLENFGFGNDTLKSISVQGDWQVILYEDHNYGGRFYQTNSTSGDLSGIPFGYGASSLKIIRTSPAAFSLYKLGDFNGEVFRSDRTVTDLSHFRSDGGSWNDRAQSMRVAPGYEVVACRDGNSRSICGRTKTDVADLNALAQGLRDNLTSVVVCKDSCPATSSVPTLVSPINTETFLPGTPISFSWVGNGKDYQLEITGGNLTAPINTSWMDSVTIWNKSGLAASTNTYRWRVKSWTIYGETQWSSYKEFKIQDIAPVNSYIFGDDSISLDSNNTFQVLTSPSAAENLFYTWSPTPSSGQGTASATYNFSVPGDKQISVTVSNTGGTATSSKTVNVGCPVGQFLEEYFNNKDLTGASNSFKCVDQIDKVWDATPSGINLGTGMDGDLHVQSGQTHYTDAVRMYLVDPVSTGATKIAPNSLNGFNAGDEILIIQMQGTGVGTYEFKKVNSIGIEGTKGYIYLDQGLTNSYYTLNSTAQVLRVPQYNNVTIDGTLSVNVWDGRAGGVMAFRVKGNMVVNGTIDVSQKGFRGGVGQGVNLGGQNGESTDGFVGRGGTSGGGEGQFGGGSGSGRSPNSPAGFRSGGAGSGGYDHPTSGGGDEGTGGGGGGGNATAGGGGAGGADNNGEALAGGLSGGVTGGNGGNQSAPGSNGYNGVVGNTGTGGQSWGSADRGTGGGGGGGAQSNLSTNKIVLGSGGGASGGYQGRNVSNVAGRNGGAGGGIIMINARNLTLNGNLNANGAPGINATGKAGAGGGGAGGSIILNIEEIFTNRTLNAIGANGGLKSGASGGGGQGGNGIIFIKSCSNPLNSNPSASHTKITCDKDNFSARFTGKVALETGMHSFNVNSDDGIRLWVDGDLLIDKWVNGEINETAEIFLEAGTYEIKLEYFENTGNAKVKLTYTTDPNYNPEITSVSSFDAYVFEQKQHEVSVVRVANPENLVYSITNSEIAGATFENNILKFTPAENERGAKKINIKIEGGNGILLEQEITVNISYSAAEFVTEINDTFDNLNNWRFTEDDGFTTTVENSELKVNTAQNMNLPKRINSKWIEVVPTKKYYLALTSKLQDADSPTVSIELYDANFNLLSTPRVITTKNTAVTMREFRTNLTIPAKVNKVPVQYAKVVLKVGDKIDDITNDANTWFDNLYFSQNGRPYGNIKAVTGIIKTGDLIPLDATLSKDPDGNTNLTYNWTQIEGTAVVIADNTSSVTTLDTSNIKTDQVIKVQLLVSDGIVTSMPVTRTFTIKGVVTELNEVFDNQDIWQNKAIANYTTSIEDGSLKLTSVAAIKASNIVSPFINISNKDYTLKYRFKGVNTRSMGIIVYGYDETFKSLGNKNCTAPTMKGTKDWTELECVITLFKDNPLIKYAKVRINYSNTDLTSTAWFDYIKLEEFNSAPTWSSIPAQVIDEDGTFTSFDLNDFVTDAENQEITFSFSGNTNLTVSIDDENIVNITPPANWSGEENITFTAKDTQDAESSTVVSFKVNAVNDAPTIMQIEPQTINQGEAFTNINLVDFASDIDEGDTLSWSISGNSNINFSIDANNVVSFSFDSAWFGEETLVFTVTDAGGLSATSSALFKVNYVDPIPADWWNTSYLNRSKLTVTNSTIENMPANFPVQIKLDETTTPKASEVFNDSKSANGNDFRMLFNNTVEVDRVLTKFSATEIEIWFGTVEPIAANLSVNDKYTVYYNNPAAGAPPANLNKIFQPVVNANTVGLWRFREGSGSVVGDLSGKANPGNFVGASWAQGLFGNAGEFGNNKYVEIPNSSNYNVSRFTAEAWVYLDSVPTAGAHVMSKWTGWGARTFFLEVRNDRKVQFYIDTQGGNFSKSSSVALDVGKWYHIAGTLDNADTMKIFVNGVMVGEKLNASAPRVSTSPIRIGQAADWPGSPSFPGKIQNVMLSNVARTNFDYAKISTRQMATFGVVEGI